MRSTITKSESLSFIVVAIMVLQHIGCVVVAVDSSFIPHSCLSTRLIGHYEFPMFRRAGTSAQSRSPLLLLLVPDFLPSSFDPSPSSPVSPVIKIAQATSKVKTTKRPQLRINYKVRQLMRLVQETLHDNNNDDDDDNDDDMNIDRSNDWKKMKTYFYHNSATLTMTQVQTVLSCLLNVYSPDLVRHIVQSSPRILKRNIKTQLQPTIDFFQSLYGPSLLQQALQRKPDLLLLRGMGYYQKSDAASAAGLDLIEVLLKHELKFTSSDIQKLQQTAPYLFQMPMVQVLSTIAYFTEILRAGFKSTLSTLSTTDNGNDNDYDNIDNDDNNKMNQVIRKLILSHPSILYLSLESNLKPRMEFLKEHCHFDASDLAYILSGSSAGILGLSITDNLAPTIHFLQGILGQQQQGHDEEEGEGANNDNSLRKCLRAHPQLLGLSLKNLQSKVAYFHAIDNINSDNNNNKQRRRLGANKSLASRILLRSPTVYSLSLNDNIIPTVNFLAKIWGVTAPNAQVVDGDCVVLNNEHTSTSSSSSSENNILSSFLSEHPGILTLSLEGNIRPTVNFFNRTGYISLDADWNLVPDSTTTTTSTTTKMLSSPPPLRARYIAASLFNRLLPRWHYCVTRENKEHKSLQQGVPHNTDTVDAIDTATDEPVTTSTQSVEGKSIVVQGRRRRRRRHAGPMTIIPLHILVRASDAAFCETMDIDEMDYQEFKKDAVPRLKFSSQFDTWLKTGRAIEV